MEVTYRANAVLKYEKEIGIYWDISNSTPALVPDTLGIMKKVIDDVPEMKPNSIQIGLMDNNQNVEVFHNIGMLDERKVKKIINHILKEKYKIRIE